VEGGRTLNSAPSLAHARAAIRASHAANKARGRPDEVGGVGVGGAETEAKLADGHIFPDGGGGGSRAHERVNGVRNPAASTPQTPPPPAGPAPLVDAEPERIGLTVEPLLEVCEAGIHAYTNTRQYPSISFCRRWREWWRRDWESRQIVMHSASS
jgi:hypothetical protein